MIKQLTIIGLGLIGASVARAIKATDFCETIAAYDKQSLDQAKHAGIIDIYYDELNAAIKNADLILIATPLGEYDNLFRQLHSCIKKDAIITDVGSVKRSVIELAENILDQKCDRFVPGHPIAGSEKHGWQSANPDLFQNKCVILTPTKTTNTDAIEIVKQFWQTIGAKIKILDANVHDTLLAATSHLPQLLTYTYMNRLVDHPEYPQILDCTGSGFRDFTRLAGSSPTLWVDICLQNRAAILAEIEQFQKHLQQLQNALEKQNGKALEKIFTTAKNAKDTLKKD